MKKYAINHALLTLFLLLPGFVYSAKPVFSISPLKNAPVIVYPGQTVSVIFKVINNSPFPLKANRVTNLPAGINQGPGGCSKIFNLAKGEGCWLYLTIRADKLKTNVKSGPMVCSAKPVYCSLPSAGNGLNIIKAKPLAKKATISITPASFSFLKGGATQVVTVTNKGPVNANAITAKLAGAPALGIKILNYCPPILSYLAPKNSCRIIFTSGQLTGSTTAVIAANNSNPITAQVRVTEEQITLTSPTHSLELSLNPLGATGEIKLTNESGGIANMIRADLAGVNGALIPSYTNCDALKPGAQCTINFKAVNSLAKTTIKIQGINTNIVELDVMVTANASAILQVKPEQIIVSPGGFFQRVTLKNISSIDAHDVHLTTKPDLGLTIIPSRPCSMNPFTLAANKECEYLFNAGAQFGDTQIIIEGSNTAAPVVIKATVSQAILKIDPALPNPFSFALGQPSPPIKISNEGDIDLTGFNIFPEGGNNIFIDSNSQCTAGGTIAAHSSCDLILNANAPQFNEKIELKGDNSNAATVFASVLTAPHIEFSSSDRLLNLDDADPGLALSIQNMAGAQETTINQVEIPGWEADTHVEISPECQPLQGGSSCIVTVKANSSAAVHLPTLLKINGDNNVNPLTAKIATYKGGGVVFYVYDGFVKVAYKADNNRLTWQNGNEAGISTSLDDGVSNTANIVAKLNTDSNYAAEFCKGLIADPIEDNDSGWYLPAICELGYNLAGGPGACDSVNQNQDMMNLLDLKGLGFNAEPYWSSTEKNPGDKAWVQSFFSSNQAELSETEQANIRCVRTFKY